MGRGVLKDYYQLYKYRLLTNIEELLTNPHNWGYSCLFDAMYTYLYNGTNDDDIF